jgi:hypothetical protein
MQPFEFIMVVPSIIIGLAIAELLSGVARVLRGELRPYWIHEIWVFTVFLLLVQYCWSLFDLAARNEWVFLDLVNLLAPPIVLFLVSSLLFPGESDRTPLADFYYSKRKPVFGLLAVLMLYYFLQEFSISAAEIAELSGFATLVVLFQTTRARLHAVLSVVYALVFVLFIAAFSYKLGESAF